MRLSRLAYSLTLAVATAPIMLSASPVLAAPAAPVASSTAATAKPAAAPENPNPLVATVNGQPIHLDEIRELAASMPQQLRQLPPNSIFPILLNQVVSQKAIQIAADKAGLAKRPEVAAAMQRAANGALQNAYLSDKVTPQLTDAAIQDYYNKNYANKAPETELHARHILVATEDQAKDVIKKLKAGADFGKLAQQLSTDKGSAAQNGGDLGWFKRGDMLPEFSAAAFAMKVNEISPTPVHTQYGWHVIQVLGSRTAAIPKLDAVRDEIRQKLIQEDVRKVVADAVADVKVVHFDPSGKPVSDTPAPAAATPAAAPKK